MTATAAVPMPVPDVDIAAARSDAERLRRVARLSAVAGERISQTAPAQWYGGASTSYDSARAELARCVDDVRRLSRIAAEAVAVYADVVGPAAAGMRSAAEDLDVALRLKAADPASVRGGALVEQAWRDYDRAHRGYRGAVEDAADALASVPGQTSPAARRPGRHIEAGARRFWQDAVAGPASFAWDLTGGLLQDRRAWWATVSAIPGGVADMVRHPLRTLDEAVAGPDWRAGEWGAAVGATLSMGLVSKRLVAASPEKVAKYPNNVADAAAPRPRLQTLDELFVRPELSGHEHHGLGHTVRRHVDVTDEYLEDRLRDGTLLDDGMLAPPPRSGKASAWADLATAELVIGDVLRDNEARVREWVASGDEYLRLNAAALGSIGRVMYLDDGVPKLLAPDRVILVLKRDGSSLFINTAYPDVK